MINTRNSTRAAGLAALTLLAAGPVLGWHAGRASAETAGGAPDAVSEPIDLVTADGRRTLHVELADTLSEQALGLMYRTQIADDRGMLFVHPVPRELSMWMRNTYIPLDMVFIKSDGTVHRIEVKTEPMSEKVIASKGEVAAVLELAGGAAERLGLKPGDKVVHRHFSGAKR